MKTVVRVRVPATSGNMGPGFDTLGVALRLYNHVEVRLLQVPEARRMDRLPPGQAAGGVKMVMVAARAFFRKVGAEERGVAVRVSGDVPIARGLGSSVTVRLGLVAGLNHLLGEPLRKEELLDLVSELEGHPDNATPALFGGMAVSGTVEGRVVWWRIAVPRSLRFVTVIPAYEMETRRARGILPTSVPMADCVHNLNRVALMVAAAEQGDFKRMGSLLDDRLHQPFRAKLIPQLYPALAAARAAGAYGGWLSGSGSTVMAITRKNPQAVGRAMARVFAKDGVKCRVHLLEADMKGLRYE
ncbi:MAG: homoserine kinase [Verrucomicrobiia bacterium]